jgi:hypothetical protein
LLSPGQTIAEIKLQNEDMFRCGWAAPRNNGYNLKERFCCKLSADSLAVNLWYHLKLQRGKARDKPADRCVAAEMAGIGFWRIPSDDKVLRVEISGLHLNLRRRPPHPTR